MEKGEAAVLAGQFGALAVALIVLANLLSVGGVPLSPISVPQVGTTVYWGPPSSPYQLTKNVVNTVPENATSISVYYTLAPQTTPASISATRLCLDANENNTGSVYNYNNVTFAYDAHSDRNYISFGPVGQQLGQTCTYTVTLTDSLQQQSTWVASVMLKPASA